MNSREGYKSKALSSNDRGKHGDKKQRNHERRFLLLPVGGDRRRWLPGQWRERVKGSSRGKCVLGAWGVRALEGRQQKGRPDFEMMEIILTRE